MLLGECVACGAKRGYILGVPEGLMSRIFSVRIIRFGCNRMSLCLEDQSCGILPLLMAYTPDELFSYLFE